ncbi:hypothetical protein O6H91_10G003700 [Diphasiastrum complanatum]|uniref:Uncharacterized protein n=1 Tax=Diphasiastrum complanatum TaxID=34168 RepID=A0ACC2CDT7_DIPCM|nr:hypothetical protein O6H91_10G003700 [Diphasiastrum complanatum]
MAAVALCPRAPLLLCISEPASFGHSSSSSSSSWNSTFPYKFSFNLSAISACFCIKAGGLLQQSKVSKGRGAPSNNSLRVSVSQASLTHEFHSAHPLLFLGFHLQPCRDRCNNKSRKWQVMASGWSEAEGADSSQENDNGGVVEFKSISDFTRFCDKDKDGAELQTAVISYCRPFPPKPFPLSLFQPTQQVDLVAAVHIADKEYFAALQKELASYNCVLYEMVADKNSGWHKTKNGKLKWRPKRQSGRNHGFNIIALIQRLMARLLQLEFQLECIDYQADNWYHADLDYETFRNLQQERGENFLTFARDLTAISKKTLSRSTINRADLDPLRLKLLWAARVLPMPLLGSFLIEGVCAPSNAPLFKSPEMKALFNLDLAAATKLFLAKNLTLESNDVAAAVIENSVIIGERNKIAMQEFEKALKDGHKKIAIFYGSGHLPDMDRRLQQQFGFVPTKVQWQTAWSITGRKISVQAGISSLLKTLADVSGWPLNRYQTVAILLFSVILAVDLWFWELFFSTCREYTQQFIGAIVPILDKGWTW